MSTKCQQKDQVLFNHTILLVGYGSEQTDFGSTPYWLAQNSWGVGWGQNGYVKILRGQNQCGVANQLYIPTEVFDPNIDTVRPF